MVEVVVRGHGAPRRKGSLRGRGSGAGATADQRETAPLTRKHGDRRDSDRKQTLMLPSQG